MTILGGRLTDGAEETGSAGEHGPVTTEFLTFVLDRFVDLK